MANSSIRSTDAGDVVEDQLAVPTLPAWKHAAASTMGASLTAIAVSPLDVVKVQMQSHVCIPLAGGGSCSCAPYPNSILWGMRTLVRQAGPSALWRGLPLTIALTVPTTGFYFTLYEALPFHPLIAGATARCIAATIASPLELVRTRVQAGAPITLFGRGATPPFRGLSPTLLRDAPFSAVYWTIYEHLKSSSVEEPEPAMTRWFGLSGIQVYIAAGSIAGSFAAVLTTPADVVKTKMQTSSRSERSMGSIVRELWKKEGAAGFLKGIQPRVARVTPSCAIMMGTYEYLKQVLMSKEQASEARR